MAQSEYDTNVVMSINALAPVAVATSQETHAPGKLPVEGGGTVKITYDIKNIKETCLDETYQSYQVSM